MNEGNPQADTKPWQDASPAPAHDPLAPDPAQAFGDYWHALGDAWAHWAANWEQWTARGFAQPHAPPADRRFAAPEWQTPYFAMLRDAYLASSRYWQEAVESAELPPREKDRLRFAVRQWLDAVSPTNFPATNPEAIKLAIATEGESLRKGAENLLTDLSRGRVAMTDESAFEVGRNLATTPGSVVFRNELIELIQYAPTTATVYERPLLMVPPCINKYYILDLQPENSFVRYAIAAGHTVFMISWRNIPHDLGRLTWDDYLVQGIFAALAATKDIAGATECNALGFCVGGAMLAGALAVLAARGDDSIVSATYLTTMLDYSDPGPIGVYVDEFSLAAREPALQQGERISGAELANVFASLRANDLVWSFVVNNYLKGRTPAAFDLLYWNSDSANLPGPMYAYYVKNCYIDNALREPGKLTMCGVPIDLGSVRMPAYVFATREDHIVPWRSAYRSVNLLGGDCEFVLGGSGHIAGVINPASKNRREYWIDGVQGGDPDEWLDTAEQRKGSWWPHWRTWLARSGGGKRDAPAEPGNLMHPALYPAPGQYVLAKA